jgi:hypothetical protein
LTLWLFSTGGIFVTLADIDDLRYIFGIKKDCNLHQGLAIRLLRDPGCEASHNGGVIPVLTISDRRLPNHGERWT